MAMFSVHGRREQTHQRYENKPWLRVSIALGELQGTAENLQSSLCMPCRILEVEMNRNATKTAANAGDRMAARTMLWTRAEELRAASVYLSVTIMAVDPRLRRALSDNSSQSTSGSSPRERAPIQEKRGEMTRFPLRDPSSGPGVGF